MRFVLHRYELTPERTFGVLYDADQGLALHTLEDPVRYGPKQAGKTAIPAGVYPLALQLSPRFGVELPSILEVPGFAGIRIHAGNTELDTEGCPLVGLGRTASRIVDSRPALAALMNRMRLNRGTHRLEVVNGTAPVAE